MAATGPSREELDNYFKNSRQYFDELARHYFATDRKYYDEYIAPYYNNPFRSMGTTSSGASSGSRAVVVFALLIALVTAGVAFFFIASEQDSTEETPTVKEKTVETSRSRSDTSSVTGSQNYELGIEYYNDKDYDNARKYLKRVQRRDKNYPDAVKKLKEIEEMNISNPDERRSKPQPKQRYN